MKHAKNAQVWVIGSMVIKSVSYASVAHLKYKSRDTVILDERMIFDVSAFWAIPLVWTESLCPTVCCVCTKLCIIEVASKRERERGRAFRLLHIPLLTPFARLIHRFLCNVYPLPGYVIIHNYRIHKKIICKSIFN